MAARRYFNKREVDLSKTVSTVAYSEKYQTLAAAGIINTAVVLSSGCSVLGLLENCNLIVVFFGIWYYPRLKGHLAPVVSRFSEVWRSLHLASRLVVLFVVAFLGFSSWHIRCIFSSLISSRALLEFRFHTIDALIKIAEDRILQSQNILSVSSNVGDTQHQSNESQTDDRRTGNNILNNEDREFDENSWHENNVSNVDASIDPMYFAGLRRQLQKQSVADARAAGNRSDDYDDFPATAKPLKTFSPPLSIPHSEGMRPRNPRRTGTVGRELSAVSDHKKSPKSSGREVATHGSRSSPATNAPNTEFPIFPQLSKAVDKARRYVTSNFVSFSFLFSLIESENFSFRSTLKDHSYNVVPYSDEVVEKLQEDFPREKLVMRRSPRRKSAGVSSSSPDKIFEPPPTTQASNGSTGSSPHKDKNSRKAETLDSSESEILSTVADANVA